MTKKQASSKKKTQAVTLLATTKEGVLAVLASSLGTPMSNTEVLDKLQRADEAVGKSKTSLGTFYPTVKRLEQEGFIKGSWGEEVVPGAKQRLLQITGTGLSILNRSRQYRALLEEEPEKESECPIPGLTFSPSSEGGAA